MCVQGTRGRLMAIDATCWTSGARCKTRHPLGSRSPVGKSQMLTRSRWRVWPVRLSRCLHSRDVHDSVLGDANSLNHTCSPPAESRKRRSSLLASWRRMSHRATLPRLHTTAHELLGSQAYCNWGRRTAARFQQNLCRIADAPCIPSRRRWSRQPNGVGEE